MTLNSKKKKKKKKKNSTNQPTKQTKKKNPTMIGDYRRKERALYFSTFKRKFSLLSEQRLSHVHFVMDPENYAAGSKASSGGSGIMGHKEQ